MTLNGTKRKKERGCFEQEKSNQSKEWRKHCRGVDGVGIQVTKVNNLVDHGCGCHRTPFEAAPSGHRPAGQGGWRRGRLRRRVRRLGATFPFPFPSNRHQAPLPAAPAAVVSQRPREPAAQPLLKAAGCLQTSRCPHLQGGRQDRQDRQGRQGAR